MYRGTAMLGVGGDYRQREPRPRAFRTVTVPTMELVHLATVLDTDGDLHMRFLLPHSAQNPSYQYRSTVVPFERGPGHLDGLGFSGGQLQHPHLGGALPSV